MTYVCIRCFREMEDVEQAPQRCPRCDSVGKDLEKVTPENAIRYLSLFNKEEYQFAVGYRDHQENVFFARTQIALVVESLFLAGFGALMGGGAPPPLLSIIFLTAGTVFTIGWWYVSKRQKDVVESARQFLKERSPGYEDLRARRPRSWPGGQRVLTHWLPCSFLILWGLLLGLQIWGSPTGSF